MWDTIRFASPRAVQKPSQSEMFHVEHSGRAGRKSTDNPASYELSPHFCGLIWLQMTSRGSKFEATQDLVSHLLPCWYLPI
jgi:hypothetical protein